MNTLGGEVEGDVVKIFLARLVQELAVFTRTEIHNCATFLGRVYGLLDSFKTLHCMANSLNGQDGAILLVRDYALCPALKIVSLKSRIPNKSFVNQASLVKMAGYWSRVFFLACWCVFRHAKKSFANIQPSLSHAWSVIHISKITEILRALSLVDRCV